MSGAVSYHGGLAAEDSVGRHYGRQGSDVLEKRRRSKAGEIDLIVRDGDTFVFVEVKKAADFAAAAARIGARQLARISRAAEQFLGQQAAGLDSPARIDAALVDQTGRIEIVENIGMA